jgi:DNA-nicking Smr family endonuclease
MRVTQQMMFDGGSGVISPIHFGHPECYNRYKLGISREKTLEIVMKKEKDFFNPAFKDLHMKTSRNQESTVDAKRQSPPPENSKPLEENPFLDAMSGVTPLPLETRKRIRPLQPHLKPSYPAPDDQQKGIEYLHSLVKGVIEMDITFSDEYVEGWVRGFSRKLMKQLKRGEFPIQDHIDLHGLTREEAQTTVRDFIVRSHRLGLRCVLIVHGRGLNSPESFPVLKEGLPLWLNRGPIRRIVLAFATARPYDGGTGAVYVLLRKR